MIGFVLAAGFGTRLRPLTDHVPKALISLCGEPLLKRSLDFFCGSGIKNIAVNSHHHSGQIESFRKGSAVDFRVFHEEGTIRGTGGALFFAREFLGSDDCFVIANVDIIAEVDLKRLGEVFLKSGSVAGLVAVLATGGTIFYNKESREYAGTKVENPASQGGLDSADFIGITFYRKEILDIITKEDFSILPVWDRARQQGLRVTVLDAGPAYWKDVGTAKSLAQVHFDVLDKKCNLSVPSRLVVDTKNKRAYPGSLPAAAAEGLGRYVWIETDSVPKNASLERTIVFSDAVVADNSATNDSLVTKYGAISLGT
jgi:mannose-1-phosphate guanylyltransferase